MPLALAKQCPACGYLHPVASGDGPDLCERCGDGLGAPLRRLFRLENVSTRRVSRISSDEEERLRIGYEVRTGLRFSEHGGVASRALLDGEPLAALAYGPAARIWRINLGWRRRRDRGSLGFLLDIERGYWQRNDDFEEEGQDDPMGPRVEKVVPFVEDHRNALLFTPAAPPGERAMASLQAALKVAIQAVYQLEDSELAAEPLPSREDRRLILFYEAAEGGAGVLRRLLDDPGDLARVARKALELTHFSGSGEDLRRAPGAREDCAAACYGCLLSYSNQPDHPLLDRGAVKDFLIRLAAARVESSPSPLPREEQLALLLRLAGSELERRWLEHLERRGHRLPARAQALLEECGTRPDFLYGDFQAAVYIDGPVHQFPERARRDAEETLCLENLGITAIRFAEPEAWDGLLDRFPSIFGPPSRSADRGSRGGGAA